MKENTFENNSEKAKNSLKAIYLPLIIAVIFTLGIYLGMRLVRVPAHTGMQFQAHNKLDVVLDLVSENYVDTLNKTELIESAIPHILSELDPHSVYIPAQDFEMQNEPLKGNFDGIGVQFNIQSDTIFVVNTISGGPSEKVGILAGDRIVTINDSLFAGVGITNEDVIKNLKGERGTQVRVGIARRGFSELIDFEITRDEIPLYSVDVSYMPSSNIGYIKVSKFAQTTFDEFLEAIEKLKKQGMEKLILDLRGNGGGYLFSAINLANQFLEDGKLIVYTQGQARPREDYFADNEGVLIDNEVVVLIDAWSASASEIVSGALQDNDRGTIIGRRSFGKGLVQESTRFRDGSAMRLTTSRYYTPTGRSIQKPYDKGNIEYMHELGKRFEHGELETRDSISFNDSLKFITPKGKIVYGGGGIMPDIFVPIDTTHNSKYFDKVMSKGLEYRFALLFADQNRKKLNTLDNWEDMLNYLEKQRVFEQFIAFAKKEGIKPIAADIKKSKSVLDIRLKAYIVRNILDDEGFYPILHQIDNTFKKAIEILAKNQN